MEALVIQHAGLGRVIYQAKDSERQRAERNRMVFYAEP